jgi:hypothetical protein
MYASVPKPVLFPASDLHWEIIRTPRLRRASASSGTETDKSSVLSALAYVYHLEFLNFLKDLLFGDNHAGFLDADVSSRRSSCNTLVVWKEGALSVVGKVSDRGVS